MLTSGKLKSNGHQQALSSLLCCLRKAQQERQTVTYRQLLEALQLPTPRMQNLVAYLEWLSTYDNERGWPLRSALVVSQTATALPRMGYFTHLLDRKILPREMSAFEQEQWHAQTLKQVYSFTYPEEDLCSGGNGEQN